MTEIGMRVVRVLGKRNFLRSNISTEKAAQVIDDISQMEVILDALSQMSALELIENITSAAAKDSGTF